MLVFVVSVQLPRFPISRILSVCVFFFTSNSSLEWFYSFLLPVALFIYLLALLGFLKGFIHFFRMFACVFLGFFKNVFFIFSLRSSVFS